jgi:hypothetical protein
MSVPSFKGKLRGLLISVFLDQVINACIRTLTELASADLKILQESCDTAHNEARRRGVAEKQRTFLAPRMSSECIC